MNDYSLKWGITIPYKNGHNSYSLDHVIAQKTLIKFKNP